MSGQEIVLATGGEIINLERADTKAYQHRRRTRWERKCRGVFVGRVGPADTAGSRWGDVHAKPFVPPPYLDFPPNMSRSEVEQFLREQRLDELSRKLLLGEYEMGDPDIRSPSPPPIYDKDGNRINRKDLIVKASMQAEQQRLTEDLMATVPGFIPPPEFKPSKKVRRIIIPQDEYPEYNFMGLIIGPRGCNHKRLEAESGAQISIRGKGTQKEGKRCDHQTDEEAAMPQHVHIAADTEEKLERAVALVEPLLDPSHPIHEESKRKGLEQLALVTGTSSSSGQAGMGANALMRAEAQCTVCGAMGHFGYECPTVQFETYEMADVVCALCGDRGHITSDCKLARHMQPSI